MAAESLLQNAATANGDGGTLNVAGQSEAGFQVTGITNATVNFEGSIDGTNWVAIDARPVAGGALVTNVTSNGLWVANVATLRRVRARISGYVSGTITVHAFAVSSLGGDGGASSINSMKAAPIGFQLVESRLVSPGANTDGSLGATPVGTRYVWVYVDSGSVYVAYGEACDVATGTSGANLGNCPRFTFGGAMLPVDDPTEGDGALHVRPTTAVSVEVAYFKDAD